MDDQVFISNIHVNTVRNLVDLDIPLSSDERKHLIITGKNGSGKTSLLLAIKQFLDNVFRGQYTTFKGSQDLLPKLKLIVQKLENSHPLDDMKLAEHKKVLQDLQDNLNQFGGLKLEFSQEHKVIENFSDMAFLMVFFEAKRAIALNIPKGINKIVEKEGYTPSEKANKDFIQYIVNLKAERSFARDDGDNKTVQELDNWFDTFEAQLQHIFDAPSLQLKFDRKNYNFFIKIDGMQPFDFTELSDGYSAIISIVAELILRMEAVDRGNYNMQGIVLIDEIETHLHVDLQRKIMPFLIDFFPNIQFIVSTHSPFVLSSVSNAVVCDLQDRIVTEDLSGYSYSALVESYFSASQYSDEIQEKLARYEELSKQSEDGNREEYLDLKQYFLNLPKYLAPELDVKLQQIKLANL